MLDLLRGPAALLVFLGHWRHLFFQDYSDIGSVGRFLKGFYLITSVGYEAVMVFFVLSGCVIAHVIHSAYASDKWGWGSYMRSRLTRLWIVLIPALVLTAMWDQAGLWMAGSDPSIYAGTGFGHVVNRPVAEDTTWWIFGGNILFLQKILVPTFGSNGPLWSISYEFVYYLTFPALVLAFLPRKFALKRLGWCVFALVVLAFSGKAIAASFLIWLMGVVAYWLYLRAAPPPKVALWGFVLSGMALLGVILMSKSSFELPEKLWSFAIGLASAVTVYFSLGSQPTRLAMRVIAPVHRLSDMSYSLYLLHTPVFIFVASTLFLKDSERWLPDAYHLTLATLLGIAVFIYCMVVWFFTEHRTPALRKWLAKFL